MRKLRAKKIETDILIVGGGTAGCYAALTIAENSDLSVLVVEKANIKIKTNWFFSFYIKLELPIINSNKFLKNPKNRQIYDII